MLQVNITVPTALCSINQYWAGPHLAIVLSILASLCHSNAESLTFSASWIFSHYFFQQSITAHFVQIGHIVKAFVLGLGDLHRIVSVCSVGAGLYPCDDTFFVTFGMSLLLGHCDLPSACGTCLLFFFSQDSGLKNLISLVKDLGEDKLRVPYSHLIEMKGNWGKLKLVVKRIIPVWLSDYSIY